MDPWEVVKWVAIFRLILPGALFRLCGGRVENLGDLQPLAVKAGLNGVMMGNFLTTLGAEPADDRAMFEELGLNVARQDDNGANPRPDNRSGWLDGETPRHAGRRPDRQPGGGELLGSLDPASGDQEEGQGRRPIPAPSEAEAVAAEQPAGWATERPWATSAQGSPSSAALDFIAACGASRARRGRASCSTAREVLLLCSNNYLGLADHPRVRQAAAEAASARAPAPARRG